MKKIEIDLEREISTYNIVNKFNDYVGMQKEVINTLKREGFFVDNVVVNSETGMIVRINPRGIKETLGSGKRFQNLPRTLKMLKVATIRKLPEIIEQGMLIEDNVENVHGNNQLYAYFITQVIVDGEAICVKVNVRKSAEVNKFWIHNVIIEKSPELLNPTKE